MSSKRKQILKIEYDEIVNTLVTKAKLSNEFGIEITVNAFFDTGAQNSCITHSVVLQLMLPNMGDEILNGANGDFISSTHLVNIKLPKIPKFVGLKVYRGDFFRNGCDLAIGMDIMSQGKLIVDNTSGKTVMIFSF